MESHTCSRNVHLFLCVHPVFYELKVTAYDFIYHVYNL